MKTSTARRSFLATCALAGAARRDPLPPSDKRSTTPNRPRLRPHFASPISSAATSAEVCSSRCIPIRASGAAAKRSTPCRAPTISCRGSASASGGQSPLNVHRLFEQIRKSGVFAGAQSGVFIAVLSAVETALWDLAGKALNVPVYQLLGGKFRDRIRVYLDTALYQAQAAHAGTIRAGCERTPPRTATPR